jgi:hypothetical protein
LGGKADISAEKVTFQRPYFVPHENEEVCLIKLEAFFWLLPHKTKLFGDIYEKTKLTENAGLNYYSI